MVESLCSSSKRDVELLDHMRSHGEDQRGHVGEKQPVQGPPHAVVVEPVDLRGRQAQQVGGVACGPFAYAVDRLPREQQVSQQDQEGLDRRELRAAIFRRQRGPQELLQPHPPHQVVEDGQGPDCIGTQCFAGRACDVSRGDRCGAIAGLPLAFRHVQLLCDLEGVSRGGPTIGLPRVKTSCPKEMSITEIRQGTKTAGGDSGAGHAHRPGEGNEVLPVLRRKHVATWWRSWGTVEVRPVLFGYYAVNGLCSRRRMSEHSVCTQASGHLPEQDTARKNLTSAAPWRTESSERRMDRSSRVPRLPPRRPAQLASTPRGNSKKSNARCAESGLL